MLKCETVLLFAFLVSSNHDKGRQDGGQSVDVEFEKDAPEQLPPGIQALPGVGNSVNDRVHEVWAILKTLEPTPREIALLSQPSGVLGTVWQYTRTVLRYLFLNAPKQELGGDGSVNVKLTKAVAYGVDLLEQAAEKDDPDALLLLGDMNFYGNFTHPRNFQTAFKWYDRLASLYGNSTAQYMLGFMYATGIGGSVERNQAKALLYHTFAAEQGHIRSELTLGYRLHSGIGSGRNCEEASHYYKQVADKVMAYWRSGPPGGRNMPKASWKWAEDDGGIYGEGASVSSSGFNVKKDSLANARSDHILEFLDMRERSGDFGAMYSLGRHYYDGGRYHKRNLKKARMQFMKIVRSYWNKDGKVDPKADGLEGIAGMAAAYIGRIFLRGEGVEQSFEKAALWFKRGIQNGNALSQHHMGLMYRDGLGVPKDAVRAAAYFKTAAEFDLPASQAAIGALFLDQGDIESAHRYFELAARHGHLEAFYYIAELTHKGVGRTRNCELATAYYKIVAERAEVLLSSFHEANAAHERGDLETALVYSMMAAEQGYESAQANVAYVLDEQTSALSRALTAIPYMPKQQKSQRKSLLHNAALALVYWTRSAKQHNIDSMIKMGDYYLSGTGTSDLAAATLTPDADKASICYQTAADNGHSAQAFWNLGWMHENGVGPIEKDFHMAKRFYDLALEANTEAYLPVKLALIKLRVRSWWNGVSGGTIKPIGPDDESEDEDGRPKNFVEWIAHFLDAADQMAEDEMATDAAAAAAGDELDLGYTGDPMPGGDGDNYEDFDDGLLESLVIIGLAATLAFLVYYRQARQAVNRARDAVDAQQQQAQQAQVGGQGQEEQQQHPGFFPNPGDPDFNQWVAGGIGH